MEVVTTVPSVCTDAAEFDFDLESGCTDDLSSEYWRAHLRASRIKHLVIRHGERGLLRTKQPHGKRCAGRYLCY